MGLLGPIPIPIPWTEYLSNLENYRCGFDTNARSRSFLPTHHARKGIVQTVDCFGDHLLHCLHGGEGPQRRDRQVILQASDFVKIARYPIVEPRDGLHRTRPDIGKMGSTGGTDFFEVIFVNSLAPSNWRVRTFNPLTLLNAARTATHRRYDSFFATTAKSRLVPVVIATLGSDSFRLPIQL